MPNDYRLTLADEAQWWEVADAQGWVQYEYGPTPEPTDEDPNPQPPVVSRWVAYPGIDFVVIGTIYEIPPEPTPEDYVPVPLPGYAVNLRFNPWGSETDIPDDMVQYIVTPADPRYTFAGGWFPGPKTPEGV